MNILGQLLRAFAKFNSDEAPRFRNSILLAIIVSFVLIVPGAFIGGLFGFTAKLFVLGLGIGAATLFLFILVIRRLPFGVEIAAGYRFAAAKDAERDTLNAVAQGLEFYVHVSAAALTSLMVIGFLLIPLPLHRSLGGTIILVMAAMAAVTLSMWVKVGEGFWVRLATWTVFSTVGFALLMIALPEPGEVQQLICSNTLSRVKICKEYAGWSAWIDANYNVLFFFALASTIIGVIWSAGQGKKVAAAAAANQVGLFALAYWLAATILFAAVVPWNIGGMLFWIIAMVLSVGFATVADSSGKGIPWFGFMGAVFTVVMVMIAAEKKLW